MDRVTYVTLLYYNSAAIISRIHQQLSLISAGDAKCLTLLNASAVILAHKYKCRNLGLNIYFFKWILHNPISLCNYDSAKNSICSPPSSASIINCHVLLTGKIILLLTWNLNALWWHEFSKQAWPGFIQLHFSGPCFKEVIVQKYVKKCKWKWKSQN